MTTLFISDLHLQEERPEITRAFFDFLRSRALDASQLYILGDFFEVWIGDDAISPYQSEIIAALRELSESCDIFFMHGNRDFLIGEHFANLAHATLLHEPTRITLNGNPTLLLHGDSLCTADHDYMQFRAMVRTPAWQATFLEKPLSERIAIARQLREKSQTETADKEEYITDVTPDEVTNTMQEHQCSLMIHGHTHRPGCHELGLKDAEGKTVAAKRMVLGDWGKTGWYIQADESGPQLREFVPQSATGIPL